MNPIDKIHLEKEYISSPSASTDLHAGGVFFCIPYEETITFFKDGTVEIKRRVIEDFRPMDGQSEIDKFNNFRAVGQYQISERNYIECQFDKFILVGLPLEKHPHILTFHCHFKSGTQGIGIAYKLAI